MFHWRPTINTTPWLQASSTVDAYSVSFLGDSHQPHTPIQDIGMCIETGMITPAASINRKSIHYQPINHHPCGAHLTYQAPFNCVMFHRIINAPIPSCLLLFVELSWHSPPPTTPTLLYFSHMWF